ncbi:MAG: cytidylate kinase family protein [Eggerthellaceae bacterium]
MAFLPDRADSRTISDRLFKSMAQVIVDLAATRNCIIEERLSDYLLRNNPNHIAVLVTAPSMPASRSCAPSAAGQARRCQARARDAACPRGVLQALLRWQVEDDGRQRHRGQPSQAWSPGASMIAAAYRFKLAEVGRDPVSVVAGELETGDLDRRR